MEGISYGDLTTEEQFIAQVIRCFLLQRGQQINVHRYRWAMKINSAGNTDVTMYLKNHTFYYSVSKRQEKYYVKGLKPAWVYTDISEIFNEN